METNKNVLRNDIEYLRIALIETTRAIMNMRDNIDSGRFQVMVMDDGAPHPANIDGALQALEYANECLKNTNPLA